jgi:hypothetical protein
MCLNGKVLAAKHSPDRRRGLFVDGERVPVDVKVRRLTEEGGDAYAGGGGGG